MQISTLLGELNDSFGIVMSASTLMCSSNSKRGQSRTYIPSRNRQPKRECRHNYSARDYESTCLLIQVAEFFRSELDSLDVSACLDFQEYPSLTGGEKTLAKEQLTSSENLHGAKHQETDLTRSVKAAIS